MLTSVPSAPPPSAAAPRLSLTVRRALAISGESASTSAAASASAVPPSTAPSAAASAAIPGVRSAGQETKPQLTAGTPANHFS